MEFINELFVDKNIKDIETVIYSLKRDIPVYNIYVIALRPDSIGYGEILSSSQFLLKDHEGAKIIGLASGKTGAQKLFAEIMTYWLEKGTLADFKEGILKE